MFKSAQSKCDNFVRGGGKSISMKLQASFKKRVLLLDRIKENSETSCLTFVNKVKNLWKTTLTCNLLLHMYTNM
jgi:hypothetical protein